MSLLAVPRFVALACVAIVLMLASTPVECAPGNIFYDLYHQCVPFRCSLVTTAPTCFKSCVNPWTCTGDDTWLAQNAFYTVVGGGGAELIYDTTRRVEHDAQGNCVEVWDAKIGRVAKNKKRKLLGGKPEWTEGQGAWDITKDDGTTVKINLNWCHENRVIGAVHCWE